MKNRYLSDLGCGGGAHSLWGDGLSTQQHPRLLLWQCIRLLANKHMWLKYSSIISLIIYCLFQQLFHKTMEPQKGTWWWKKHEMGGKIIFQCKVAKLLCSVAKVLHCLRNFAFTLRSLRFSGEQMFCERIQKFYEKTQKSCKVIRRSEYVLNVLFWIQMCINICNITKIQY